MMMIASDVTYSFMQSLAEYRSINGLSYCKPAFFDASFKILVFTVWSNVQYIGESTLGEQQPICSQISGVAERWCMKNPLKEAKKVW